MTTPSLAHVDREPVHRRESRQESWTSDRWLIAIVLVGLLLRIGLAVATNSVAVLIGDDGAYARGAAALLDGRGLQDDGIVRPPLYFLFIAAVQAVTRDWSLTAKIIQCLASVATAIPVYRIARRVAGRRAGRLAAGFLVFSPTSIAYSHLLWPETLFTLLVAWVFDAATGFEALSRRGAAAVGFAIGLAMILKPVMGLFTPLLARSWIRQSGLRSGARLTAIAAATALITIAPWMIRNQLRYGPSILLENEGPFTLWVGNDPRPPSVVHQEWLALPDPVVRSHVALSRSFAVIRADPWRFVRWSAVRAINLWGLEFFVVRNVIFGGYGPVQRETLLTVFWIVEAAYVLLLVFAVTGWRVARSDPTLRLGLVYAVVFTAIVCTMRTTTRFRFPFEFLLCVAAGAGADRFLRGRFTWRDGIVVVPVLVLLTLSAYRSPFREIIDGRFGEVAALRNPDWYQFRY